MISPGDDHDTQNPDVQPLGLNPIPDILPGVSSGVEAITVSFLHLRTSGMHQGPPTMGSYPQMPNSTVPPSAPQEMIPSPPPSYATEGKNDDDVLTSEVKTTSTGHQQQHKWKGKREIVHQDHEKESDYNPRKMRRKSSSMLEEKRQQADNEEETADRLREEVEEEDKEIAEGKRRAIEELLQYQQEAKNASAQDHEEKNTSPRVVSIEYSDVKEKQKICDGMKNISLHDKQLIDMIPNTMDEVLSYEINWDVSDQHELHKKMRPWISKKIMDFLEDDADGHTGCILIDMRKHVCASQMLKRLQVLLGDEAEGETFFLNLWRMLIFEIKRKEEVAGFAERFFNVHPNEERSEVERAKNMRSGDSLSKRDRHCDDAESSNCDRDANKDIIRDSRSYQQYLHLLNSFGLKSLWDFEQFIDMIPKTKEDLFSYEINWASYDKHEMYKRMTPWILEKVMEFFKKFGATTVDYIVTSIKDHACPSKIMEYLLETMLDYQAEEFVPNMWRMLIFEIKKVETVKLADRISNADPKEERCEGAMELNMRTGNMSSHLDRDYSVTDDVVMRNSVGDVSTMLSVTAESDIGQSSKAPLCSGFHGSDYVDDANKEKKMSPRVSIEYSDVKKKQKIFDGEVYQDLAFDGKKLSLHDKQLIDIIPNAKDEVLSYEINWDVSDQHELHKKMRPWISKRILEFLEEDADRTAECILMSMGDHVCASQMLEMLQVMFMDEAEIFFLNLWRMIIFEIKKKIDVSEIATRTYNRRAEKEKSEMGRAINMRSGDKSSEHDRDWNDVKSNNLRVVKVDKIRDSDSYQDLLILLRTFNLKMLREVEQFIDVIPKTKEMLFSCEINWALADKHELHKKMTPWISKNVTEFLEEDEDVLVDMIVYCIEHHICASRVLEMIQLLLKDEGEMFFLQFWRMLIFEIKKVETVAEFAKHFSKVDPKEERSEVEMATDTRSGENLSQRDRHCDDVESSNCARDANKDIIRDSKSYQQHVLLLSLFGSKRVWDLEQFIDMIPKTKGELFSYEINWDLFDEHEVHKNMRPWIWEKIMEFYERREATTVDYIVTTIKDHSSSSQMVYLLQPMLGDQAEKFALNILRMLIFEIKKVETDLDQKTLDSNRYPGLRSILKVYDTEDQRRVKRIAKTIPKTKEVLFSYNINWMFYEQYGLKWNMRIWISLEIKDFVRREDANLVVYYILSSIDDHIPASRMLERLQPILGDKSEMFVQKLWSTIIFGTRLVCLTKPPNPKCS